MATDRQPFPLHHLLMEINVAADNEAYLLALSMCVALPDICASLISDDGRTDSKRYKAWCEEHLGAKFNAISAADLYSMRCGVLHNGRFGDMKNDYGRVLFAVTGGNVFVNCALNDAYWYDAREFCRNFTDAVYDWIDKYRDHANVVNNASRLMQYHVGGLMPYVSGVTVVA